MFDVTPDRYYHNDEIDDRFERLYLLRDQGKSLIVWDRGLAAASGARDKVVMTLIVKLTVSDNVTTVLVFSW